LSERLCWIKLKKMMKVSAAYEILQLEQSASAEEINASYRRLLMEYHPDRNVDRADWSHQMTIRLTEAYEAVLTYIESLEASEALRKAAEEEQLRGSEAEEEADSGYSLGTQAQIAGLYDQILDQIHSYYNEGMDKIYLRQEGSMRQRYRAVLRRLYPYHRTPGHGRRNARFEYSAQADQRHRRVLPGVLRKHADKTERTHCTSPARMRSRRNCIAWGRLPWTEPFTGGF
jgi:curved DNA-binding protein CbpA